MKLQTRQIVLAGLMGALLMVLKEALAPVPGVEPVSLLVILYALCLPAAAPSTFTSTAPPSSHSPTA